MNVKLLVVDDEFFIRRGIIDSINWNEYDVEVCGEASNGQEALEILPDLKPDLILCDIRMNPMNGLEFITKAREMFPQLKFLILSGYDEFEYAQKAISLGVSEYLLKPVGVDELIRVVTKVRDEILHEQAASPIPQDPKLSNSIMSVWNTPQDKLTIEESYFRVFLFAVDNPKEILQYFSHNNSTYSLQYISVIAQNYFTMRNMNYVVKKFQRNVYTVMLNYADSNLDIYDILDEFREYLYAQCKASITLGIGGQYYGYHQITTSYNEAFAALGYKYAFPDNTYIFSEQIPSHFIRDYMNAPRITSFHKEELNLFSLHPESEEKLVNYLDTLYRRFQQQNLPLEDQQTIMLKLAIQYLQEFGSAFTSTSLKKIVEIFEDMCHASENELREDFLKIHRIIQQTSQDQDMTGYQDIAAITIKYIKSHYSEDLSLNLLAQQVHVTPNYLSRIFKESTGENFKEYLTRYRINQAKDLLLNTSLKLYEIAETIGFHDYKYFSLIFKKYVGCSASDYRMNTLMEQNN